VHCLSPDGTRGEVCWSTPPVSDTAMIARVQIHPLVDGCAPEREVGGIEAPALAHARAEFAHVPIVLGRPPFDTSCVIRLSEWRSERWSGVGFDATLDERAALGDAGFVVEGTPDELDTYLLGVLTRAQRCAERTNAASRTPTFRYALAAHGDLHDLSKPLVLADYRHAVDTWQWVLRLEPRAGLEVQLAALFHDVERLCSESDVRIEHSAPDYQAFKNAHAGAGADLARSLLRSQGVDAGVANRVGDLIRKHEQTGGDPELALLNDADALSFFSLNSDGFVSYFGPEHSQRKVRYTMGRLSPQNRWRLRTLRLCDGIRTVLDREGWQ
jgi:hypothetical protein